MEGFDTMSSTEIEEPPVHILKSAEVHVFDRVNYRGTGARYVAKFYPYSSFPIIFKGDTYEGVVESIETFREEQLAIHEKGFLNRAAGAKKRKDARDKKEKA
jgi:hypothetical protein